VKRIRVERRAIKDAHLGGFEDAVTKMAAKTTRSFETSRMVDDHHGRGRVEGAG
jgi:hypothetical protein